MASKTSNTAITFVETLPVVGTVGDCTIRRDAVSEPAVVAGVSLQLEHRSGTTSSAIAAAAVSAIDDGAANSVTLAAADTTILAGQTLQLIDAAGQTCLATPKASDLKVASVTAAIAGAAVASIDDGTANSVTLAAADATILKGQKLRLADAPSQTCNAAPKGSDLLVKSVTHAVLSGVVVASIDDGAANSITLATADTSFLPGQQLQLASATSQTCAAAPLGANLVIASVSGAVITFTTDITSGDGSAASNCVLNRAAVVEFHTDITTGDGSAATNCVLTRSNVIAFETDISLGDAAAATNCAVSRAAPCDATPMRTALAVASVASNVVTFGTGSITGSATNAATSCVVTAASKTIPVTGLTNGQSYTFGVVAESSVGYSSALFTSTASAPTTPGKVPDAPRITGLAASDGTAVVSFSAPDDAGGASIVLYTVTASPGGATATRVQSPITVTGLTNGVAYSFSATAHNYWGESAGGTVSTYGSGSCCCDTVVGDGSREDCVG